MDHKRKRVWVINFDWLELTKNLVCFIFVYVC